MGGGTGTGAAAVIGKAAREEGALTVGVVTKPFGFEGAYKMALAEEGIKKLRDVVDTLITIPNQRLLTMVERTTSLVQAYLLADDVLRQGVQGISDLITKPGLVNIDFADVESTMKNQGDALMGIGFGAGENRATEAAKRAIDNPLLEETTIAGATRILVNVAGNNDLGLHELEDIVNIIRGNADPNVALIHGITLVPELEDNLRVTVIATGFAANKSSKANPEPTGEPVKLRETDFINISEWPKIRDSSAGKQPEYLSRRGGPYSEEDLEVPTVFRKPLKYPLQDSAQDSAEGR
jgi:cell division protein FtsZ